MAAYKIALTSPRYFEGAQIPNVKVLSKKVDEIINQLNPLLAGTEPTANPLVVANATASTSTTTGALQVAGGVGIVGATWIGGLINVAGAATIGGALAVTGVSTFTGQVTFQTAIIDNHAVPVAINSTGGVTAAQLLGGYITSTSAAGTTITLPTATLMGTALSASQGTVFDFIVDNTAGASTVTMAVATGIVAAKQVSSGDTAADVLLTVAASATVGIGYFRLVFSSATAAVLFRVG